MTEKITKSFRCNIFCVIRLAKIGGVWFGINPKRHPIHNTKNCSLQRKGIGYFWV